MTDRSDAPATPDVDAPHPDVSDSLHRDAVELHSALSDLIRLYQFRDRSRICCEDISVTQCYALSAMIRLGSPTLRELAEEMYLDKSTTSRVVDSLVRKRHARRVADPADGRVVRIEPSTHGRSLSEKIERRLVEQEKDLIADFDPEVRQATARLIARLARAAKERLSRYNGACGKTRAED
jgi:DNA-binding MarR family transcriptional regulator